MTDHSHRAFIYSEHENFVPPLILGFWMCRLKSYKVCLPLINPPPSAPYPPHLVFIFCPSVNFPLSFVNCYMYYNRFVSLVVLILKIRL